MFQFVRVSSRAYRGTTFRPSGPALGKRGILMRAAIYLVMILLLSPPAIGTPQLLDGGAFIAHYVPEVGFSVDPPAEGWCAAYQPYSISSCEDQNNRIDVSGTLGATWYVLAAWYLDDKIYCGVEFGLGEYDARVFEFSEYGPCYSEGGYELPTAGWPGPNEGTAITVGTGHWSGNFQAVYYFGGYAYSHYGAEIIPLSVNPTTGNAGSANCIFPVGGWDAAELGGLGINTRYSSKLWMT